MWKNSAQGTSRLFAASVRKVTSPANTASSTDVRNASRANTVRLKASFKTLPRTDVTICTRARSCTLRMHVLLHTTHTCGLISYLSTGYTQKCTATTDAVCSCQHGFLCSNRQEDSVGGRPKPSPTQAGRYLSVHPSVRPSAKGPTLALVSGNNSSDCRVISANKQGSVSDLVSVILPISFLLLSVVLLLLLATSCLRKLRRLSRKWTSFMSLHPWLGLNGANLPVV